MRDSFRYTIVSNEEANYLLTTLDDILYSALAFLDNLSPIVKAKYSGIVLNYAFHPVDGRSSHSSKASDSILLCSLFWIHDDPKWLDIVRHRVSLFRLYWMDFLHDIDNKCSEYQALVDVDSESDAYLEALQKRSDIESWLGVGSDTAYGIVSEIGNVVKRMVRIVRKLTYPYLRKVVTHAKHYGLDNPSTFMENFQNGSVGIRIAIGRHDCALGAFASTVDRWINNRIMTFIRDNGMLVRVPDRAFTHKNIVDKHLSRDPLLSLEDIAEKEGIKYKLLVESMTQVQSQTGYIDLQDEDESTSKHSHEYIDRSTDPDSPDNTVKGMIQEYASLLRPRERVLLSIVYGVEDAYATHAIDDDVKRSERARQVFHIHTFGR